MMKNNITDLTHIINKDIPVYPGTLHPTFKPSNTIEKDGFAELELCMCSHTGTHMDAPAHLLKEAKSLDQFPISKFLGKAVVISCEGMDEISKEYLKQFEKLFEESDFILFRSGWQKKWNTPQYFEAYPVLTTAAADWLTKFNLKGVGYDSISADAIDTSEYPNHRIFFNKEMLIIENLTNLDKLPEKEIFEFQCIPLYIENADGSPIRAIALH